jgi:CubicO group peptidase (beta-lactamase class C family)
LSLALWVTLAAAEFPTRGWKTSTAEAENVDASALEALHQDLASGKHGYVDAVSASSNPGRERKYGFQWWLLPYEGSKSAWAAAALGYGGQFLFVVPEYDLIAVFTGWNIYDRPELDAHLALSRVIDAVR